MTLTKLSLENFRAFERAEVTFAPITFLVGPNNAGKSSILSGLKLLSHTLLSVDPDTSLLVEELGSYKDAVFGHDLKKNIRIGVEFRDGQQDYGFSLAYAYRIQRREIILKEFTLFEVVPGGGRNTILRTEYSKATGRQLLKTFSIVPPTVKLDVEVAFLNFLPRIGYGLIEQVFKKNYPQSVPDNFSNYIRRVTPLTVMVSKMRHFLASLQYLGPFRLEPERLYQFAGERPSRLSSSGAGATDILSADSFKRGRGKRRLTESVQEWLTAANIASRLDVRAVTDRHYDIQLTHPTTHEKSNLADTGFGASQILPILVAGFDASPETLLMVEQPELHLHPKAQAVLGEFFFAMKQGNVQCLAETHSEHLLLRIQQKVALGELKPDEVAVNYINPTEHGKCVLSLPIGEDGLFTRKWPQGFFQERMDEVMALARAPLRRRIKS